MTARLQSRHSKTTVVAVYAPTADTDEEDADEFYLQLQDVLNGIRKSDIVILLGDLNAQISGNRQGAEHVIGPHGSAHK
jgi:exonuclease III